VRASHPSSLALLLERSLFDAAPLAQAVYL
jgi:hypothetical protein